MFQSFSSCRSCCIDLPPDPSPPLLSRDELADSPRPVARESDESQPKNFGCDSAVGRAESGGPEGDVPGDEDEEGCESIRRRRYERVGEMEGPDTKIRVESEGGRAFGGCGQREVRGFRGRSKLFGLSRRTKALRSDLDT